MRFFVNSHAMPSFAIAKSGIISALIFLACTGKLHAQETGDDGGSKKYRDAKGFHAGLYIGSLFASKYSAATYDGYGFDINGNKNNFSNSLMYRRIVYDYGGGNNFPDQIAPAVGVVPGDWSFDSTDMPALMKYTIAFQVGLDLKYYVDKKSAFVFNLNASKLTAHGDFTITKVNYNTSLTGGPQGPYVYDPFVIIGTEQRLIFQFGFQHISHIKNEDHEKKLLNFFYEIGPDLVLAKYDKNQIDINGLRIDLNAYYTTPIPGFSAYRPKNLTGEGFGIWGGLGWDLNTGGKWSMQFLYSPSYDKINIGKDPKRTLQHGIGIRMYYDL